MVVKKATFRGSNAKIIPAGTSFEIHVNDDAQLKLATDLFGKKYKIKRAGTGQMLGQNR